MAPSLKFRVPVLMRFEPFWKVPCGERFLSGFLFFMWGHFLKLTHSPDRPEHVSTPLARSALERRKILEQAFKTGGGARSSAAL